MAQDLSQTKRTFSHSESLVWDLLTQDVVMITSLDGIKRELDKIMATSQDGCAVCTGSGTIYLLMSCKGSMVVEGIPFSPVYGLPGGSWWTTVGDGMLDKITFGLIQQGCPYVLKYLWLTIL